MSGTSGTGLMILSTTRDSMVVELSDGASEKNNFHIAGQPQVGKDARGKGVG